MNNNVTTLLVIIALLLAGILIVDVIELMNNPWFTDPRY